MKHKYNTVKNTIENDRESGYKNSPYAVAELIDNSLVNLRIMTQGKYAKLLDLAVAVPDKNVVFSAANKGMHAVMQTPLAQEIINLDEVTLEKILELYQKEVIPRMALPNTQLSKTASPPNVPAQSKTTSRELISKKASEPAGNPKFCGKGCAL